MDIISLNSLLISTQRINRIGHDQQIKSSSLYQQRKESGFYEEMAKIKAAELLRKYRYTIYER